MAGATSPAFQYDPLSDSESHIRLLRVESQDVIEYIHITLIETSLQDAPSYHAISYAWGDATATETILIGDSKQVLTVRKACAGVLRQLLHFKTSQYYWIDAICINQYDASEKESQVVEMRNIYSRADCVLACVGLHEEDSEWLAITLRSFDKHLALFKTSTDLYMEGRKEWTEDTGWCLFRCYKWLQDLTPADTERLFRAMDSLARRPYFWRIWILQELFLASQIRLFCGFDELKLSTLLFWWCEAKLQFFFVHKDGPETEMEGILWGKLSDDYLKQARWTRTLNVIDFGPSGLGQPLEDRLYERVTSSGKSNELERIYLGKVLEMCESRGCKDSRDSVYGTLAFANWNEGFTILPDGSRTTCAEGARPDGVLRPDYTRSTFDLAKVAILHFNTMLELEKLILSMLRLDSHDENVARGISLRRNQSAKFDVATADIMTSALASPQDQVQVVEGAIHITADMGWELCAGQSGGHSYAEIYNPSGQPFGLCSSSTKFGDWIMLTDSSHGLVLRKTGRYYVLVGRVFILPDRIADNTKMTAFMLWFGVEDLIVHLAGHISKLDDIYSPEEGTLISLETVTCGQSHSSFAEIPGEMRQFEAHEFRLLLTLKKITFQLIADWHGKFVEK